MSNTGSFIPAAPPPSGVTSNPSHPEDVGHTAALVVSVVCTAIFNILFFIHAYVKLRVKQGKFLFEDWFCLAAWICTNVLAASMLGLTLNGAGQNVWDMSLERYTNFLKWLYISSCVYSPAAFFTKATLLLLIARVFSVKPMFSRGVKIFICTLALAYLPAQGLKAFICTPVSAFWEPAYNTVTTGKNRYCLDQAQLFMCDVSIAIITDVVILILPIPLVWGMRAPRRQKVKMIILLGAGGAATASTVVRAYLIVKYMHSKNMPGDFAGTVITTVLELSVGFACVCLPSAKLVFDRATTSIDSTHRNWFGRMASTAPERKPGSASTYWESIRSKVTTTTRSGSTIARGLSSPRFSRPWRRGNDIELGFSSEPVVFQQRLEVPSLRSTSDARSFISRGGDHRGLTDAEFAHCLEQLSSQKGQEDEFTDSRKGSNFTVNLEDAK
ncbi:hypothetical protein KVR01_004459 [Diaporthe batatas]|uniref:uncharacterized protein n=1 Tax=Diaporthe batatas TaxID=748121 RepID=UPI001D039A22|nr:uncharacterized protein KVR01_004459 [Diaporthe batatas]KAG8165907.1 hypothetical protein KVR01_004459 [Diaporthe batatas]